MKGLKMLKILKNLEGFELRGLDVTRIAKICERDELPEWECLKWLYLNTEPTLPIAYNNVVNIMKKFTGLHFLALKTSALREYT